MKQILLGVVDSRELAAAEEHCNIQESAGRRQAAGNLLALSSLALKRIEPAIHSRFFEVSTPSAV